MSRVVSQGQEETTGQEWSSALLSSFIFKNKTKQPFVNVGGETGIHITLLVRGKISTTSLKGSWHCLPTF